MLNPTLLDAKAKAASNVGEAPESRRVYVIGSMLTLGSLALIFTMMRVRSRWLIKHEFGLDDAILVFVALPFSLALAVVTALMTNYGLGKHMADVDFSDLVSLGRGLLATQFLWAASTTLVKLSILAFYFRVFGSSPLVARLGWCLVVYTAAWAVAVLAVLGLQCRPLSATWDPGVPGAMCIDTTAFYIVGSATNVAGDVAILVLPLPTLWRLQVPLARRLFVMGIFALGSLTCVISLVRLVQLATATAGPEGTRDVTFDSVQTTIWSVAEPCLGIVSASLPTVQPVVKALRASVDSLWSAAARVLLKRAPDVEGHGARADGGYKRFDAPRSLESATAKSTGRKPAPSEGQEGIKVTYSMEMRGSYVDAEHALSKPGAVPGL